MIKKIALAGIILALTAVAVVAGTQSAQADSANSAVVIKDTGCGLLNGNGAFTFTTENQIVDTNSGNSKITCKAQVTPDTTAKGAVKWNFANTGLLCSTTFGVTQDWEEVVTPNGQASLQCHINPNPTP